MFKDIYLVPNNMRITPTQINNNLWKHIWELNSINPKKVTLTKIMGPISPKTALILMAVSTFLK